MDVRPRRAATNDYLKPLNLYADTYAHYSMLLYNLAQTLFEWKNVPEYIPDTWMEKILIQDGRSIAFMHESVGFLITRVTENGRLNIFEEPVSYKPYAVDNSLNDLNINGYELTKMNSVLIKNTPSMNPTTVSLSMFANRLTNIMLTMDVNLYSLRTPLLIAVDERQRLTWENILGKYDGYGYVIKGEKDMLTDFEQKFKVVNMQSPFNIDKLRDEFQNIMSEILVFMGINTASTNKKSRLVSDEAVINFEQVDMNAQIMFKTRKNACELINKMFNMNLDVVMRKYSEESVRKLLNLYNDEAQYLNKKTDVINGKDFTKKWSRTED